MGASIEVSLPKAMSALAATKDTIIKNKAIFMVAGDVSDCIHVLATVVLPSKKDLIGSAHVLTTTIPI